MLAIKYNFILWLPIVLYFINLVFTLLRNKLFLLQFFRYSKKQNLQSKQKLLLIGVKAFYTNERKEFSIVNYIKIIYRHQILLFKIMSLCITLDFMQNYDDVSNIGQYFDNLRIDFFISIGCSTITIFILSFFFYKYFIEKIQLYSIISFRKTFIGYIIACIISIIIVFLVRWYLDESVYSEGLNKPIDYLVSFFLPFSTIVWLIYLITTLLTKILIIPASLGLVISTLSIIFPAVVYFVILFLIRTSFLNKYIYLIRNKLLRRKFKTFFYSIYYSLNLIWLILFVKILIIFIIKPYTNN